MRDDTMVIRQRLRVFECALAACIGTSKIISRKQNHERTAGKQLSDFQNNCLVGNYLFCSERMIARRRFNEFR